MKYTVLNPRGIPAGKHIIRVGERRYMEGEMFEPPSGCDIERLLRDGFLERAAEKKAVKDG